MFVMIFASMVSSTVLLPPSVKVSKVGSWGNNLDVQFLMYMFRLNVMNRLENELRRLLFSLFITISRVSSVVVREIKGIRFVRKFMKV